jgi:hypothetical protein
VRWLCLLSGMTSKAAGWIAALLVVARRTERAPIVRQLGASVSALALTTRHAGTRAVIVRPWLIRMLFTSKPQVAASGQGIVRQILECRFAG